MITLNNVNNQFITGSVNGETFGINYTKEKFGELQKIEASVESAKTPAEVKELVEKFKAALVEDPNTKKPSEMKDIYISNEGKYYLQVDGKISAVSMPQSLVDRFKDSLDKGIDVQPLIKCWIRFMRNHKLRNICKTKEEKEAFTERFFNYVNQDFLNGELFNDLIENKGYTEEVAEALATVKQVKITKEGLIATYKVSKEITKRYKLNDKGEKESYDVYQTGAKSIDPITGLITTEKVELENEDRVFEPAVVGQSHDAFYCGDVLGHIIKVGQTHRLEDWSQVNTNDDISCVKGLHIGGLTYIKGYQNQGTETHNTLVDPMHIGAVTDDGSGALRVIQYYTLDAFSGVNGSIYHSSTYAAQVDSEWETQKQEIIKEFGELQTNIQEQISSLN